MDYLVSPAILYSYLSEYRDYITSRCTCYRDAKKTKIISVISQRRKRNDTIRLASAHEHDR